MALDPATSETTVDTDITEQDVIDFRSYHLANSRIIRRKTWITLLVILLAWCALLALMVFSSTKPLEAAKDLWPLLCGPPLFVMAYFPFLKWRMRRLSRKLLREGRNRTMLGSMKVALTAQGVSEVGEFGNTFVKWQGIEKVAANASAIYIYTGAASAVIVPRRAFQSDEEFTQFGAEVRKNISKS